MEHHPLRAGAEARAQDLAFATYCEHAPLPTAVCTELTLLTKAGGPLTKRIGIHGSGVLVADGSACIMVAGQAARARLAGPAELARLIGSLRSDQALALGRLRRGVPNCVAVVTARRLREDPAPSGGIARTREHIDYVPGEPAYL